MAGSGSRLRKHGFDSAKPLVPICGRPLVSYTFDSLIQGGIKIVHAVVGFEGDMLIARMRSFVPASLDLHFIINENWEKQNGISVLAAANQVDAPFLLTMGDHLFDESMMDLLVRDAVPDQLNLAVDRKLDAILDPNDATKVQTEGERIVAIGKQLQHYDAIDTGLFVCAPNIFEYLERAKRSGDCSLSDGVRLMAGERKARAIDIGEAWWQDVDTPEMLAQAEKHLRARSQQIPKNI